MYIYQRLCFLYATRWLSKYLKVYSSSGTRIMSNDDHLLVPVVDIVPAYRNTQGNVTCVSNLAGVGFAIPRNITQK
jgi:hypothetical protein